MTVALEYQRLGAGAPLVILHGLFGSGTNWRGIARRLADTHDVWLVDQRNHGRSPHAAGMSYPQLAADVRALLDRHQVARCALLGHSMGGKVAMRFALESPHRVARLVVVDIAPRPTGSGHEALIGAMQAALPAPDRAAVDRALATNIADPALRAFLLQNLVVTPGAAPRWRLGLDHIRAAMGDLCGFPDAPASSRFDRPALFVHGTASDYLDAADVPAIRALFPTAVVAPITGAGHWLHAERPNEFLDLVTPFLHSD